MRSARRHPMSRECSWLLHDYSNSALGDTGCASVSGVQLQTIRGTVLAVSHTMLKQAPLTEGCTSRLAALPPAQLR